MIIPPPCLWIGAGETMSSTSSPSDCWRKKTPEFLLQTRSPFTSLQFCSQKIGLRSVSDQYPLDIIPCSDGESPVRSVACATHVTAGNTDAFGANLSPAISVIPFRSRSL